MKKHFVVLVVIIFSVVMVLANCSHLGKSMRPGLGPIIGGEDDSYNSSVVTYYLTVKYFIIDGGGEIWVESNFLSNEYLFSLAKEISAERPYAAINSLNYSDKKSGRLLGKSYFITTCFIRDEEIEVQTRTNMVGDMIVTISGVFPYEELPPPTEKHGYFITIRKKNYTTKGVLIFENHRNRPVVFLFDPTPQKGAGRPHFVPSA